MDKLLTLRAALIASAFLLAGFGIHNAFLAVFSQGAFEVIYNYDETVRMCIERHCVYSAELAIANTGEVDQESVAVEISHIPGGIRGSPRVLNLSAAEPRQADPRIDSASRLRRGISTRRGEGGVLLWNPTGTGHRGGGAQPTPRERQLEESPA